MRIMILILLITVMALMDSAIGTVIRVPDDYPTIQAGIDAAISGDTVLIAAGIYTGEGNREISIAENNIFISGESGTANTIIDGEGAYQCFAINGMEIGTDIDSNTVISDLTIRNSTTGIYAIWASPKLTNLIISQCLNSGINVFWTPEYKKGAKEPTTPLIMRNCSITNNNIGICTFWTIQIENCIISSNGQAGILKENNRTAIIKNTIFEANGTAVSAYYTLDSENNQIDSCQFYNNGTIAIGALTLLNSRIVDGSEGFWGSECGTGGMEYKIENCYIEGLTGDIFGLAAMGAEINNCIITNNSGDIINVAPGECCGAVYKFSNCIFSNNNNGISLYNDCYLEMNRCVYKNNSGPIFLSLRQGECKDFALDEKVIKRIKIANCNFIANQNNVFEIDEFPSGSDRDSLCISNCIIADNAGYGINTYVDPARFAIYYNDAIGNVSGNYGGFPDQTGINGNISENPLFLGSDPFDYHLTNNSPCIDAGDPMIIDSDSSVSDIGVYPFLHGNPNIPTIISPENGTVVSLSNYLSWLKVANPYEYDTVYYAIQIDDDSLFGSIDVEADSISGYDAVLDQAIAVSLSALDTADILQDNASYFWRLNAKNKFNDESGFTDSSNYFYLNMENDPPEPFALYTPVSGLRWVDYYTYFCWGRAIDDDPLSSITYTMQISPDSLFGNNISSVDNLTDTSLTLITDSLALLGVNLYWRVLAIDDDSLFQTGGLPEPETRKLTLAKPGDANADGIVIGSDVTYLVNYFRGINPIPNPPMAGDTNSNCQLISSDVTYLVGYLRGINPAPYRGDCEQLLTKK